MNILKKQLTPGMNFGILLSNEFNIKLPNSTPTYIAENIYKECIIEHQNGMSLDEIKIAADNAIKSFNGDFPWADMEYDDIPEYTESHDKQIYEDGDIVYNKETGMYAGYYDNRIVSFRTKLEKMKDVMERKYGITEFNVLINDNKETT